MREDRGTIKNTKGYGTKIAGEKCVNMRIFMDYFSKLKKLFMQSIQLLKTRQQCPILRCRRAFEMFTRQPAPYSTTQNEPF